MVSSFVLQKNQWLYCMYWYNGRAFRFTMSSISSFEIKTHKYPTSLVIAFCVNNWIKFISRFVYELVLIFACTSAERIGWYPMDTNQFSFSAQFKCREIKAGEYFQAERASILLSAKKEDPIHLMENSMKSQALFWLSFMIAKTHWMKYCFQKKKSRNSWKFFELKAAKITYQILWLLASHKYPLKREKSVKGCLCVKNEVNQF